MIDAAAPSTIEIFVFIGTSISCCPIVPDLSHRIETDPGDRSFQQCVPHHWSNENFNAILSSPEEIPIFRWLFNSIFISSAVTILVLSVDSMAAYALARLDLPGRKWIFALIISTLMVPGQVLLVPVYLILNKLGWLDTPLALIAPAGAGHSVCFCCISFIRAFPRSSTKPPRWMVARAWGFYWHILLPLSKPALATLAIFTFIGSWNDFLGPLVFLDSVEKYTLPVGVALFQTSYLTEYGLTLAASVICTLPVILIFLIFHKHIIRGFVSAGLKE